MRVVLLLLSILLLSACASLETQVLARAARDFSCAQDATRIVDREARNVDRADRVFRVAGCGSIATYECHELPTLSMRCSRLREVDAELRRVTTATGKYSLSPAAP